MSWKLVISTAAVSSLALVASAQQACEGEKPILHDDGTYRFNTESWVRAGKGVHYYGRCIGVVSPTEKLLHSWIGVPPLESIARKDRPTIGGHDYVTRDTVDASAKLYYGNSDDDTVASYLAHSRELAQTAETGNPADRAAISEALERFGELVLRSSHQVSFLIERDDEESLTDLDLTFLSQREGQTHKYVVNYMLDMQSEVYEDQTLFISFRGESLRSALLESTGSDVVAMREGSDEISFVHDSASQSDFIRHQIDIIGVNGEELTQLPITYMLPVQ